VVFEHLEAGRPPQPVVTDRHPSAPPILEGSLTDRMLIRRPLRPRRLKYLSDDTSGSHHEPPWTVRAQPKRQVHVVPAVVEPRVETAQPHDVFGAHA
jgi:hypothetical protein